MDGHANSRPAARALRRAYPRHPRLPGGSHRGAQPRGDRAGLAFCRDDAALAFDMLVDLTAVDYSRFPGREDGPRFEVVYHLYSVAHNHRVRLKVPVEQDDPLFPPHQACGPSPTGRSARCGTCSASASTATRTCAGS